MTDTFDSFIDELTDGNADLDEMHAKPTKSTDPKYARKTYTCTACNGTGLWAGGRRNRHGNARCNVCHGRGTFVTSPEARAKAREAARDRKLRKEAEAQADNIAAIGGEDRLAKLRDAGDWSGFAASLYDQHRHGKLWSQKQTNSINSMLEKLDAHAAERKAAAEARKAAAPEVDLTPIREMFETAVSNGYKRPIYRAEGLVINRAPDHGRNPGALYVKDDSNGDYLGKVLGLKFHAARDGERAATPLAAIAADPSGAAVRYGQRTGKCSCCGRKLTNHASIEAGIGPICASRWGLG